MRLWAAGLIHNGASMIMSIVCCSSSDHMPQECLVVCLGISLEGGAVVSGSGAVVFVSSCPGWCVIVSARPPNHVRTPPPAADRGRPRSPHSVSVMISADQPPLFHVSWELNISHIHP